MIELQTTLFSIGYGASPWDDFLARLQRYEIEYLIDVRTRPVSRQPEFNREMLESLCRRNGILYAHLGHELGGMPDDPECYVDGRIDYAKCRERPSFKNSLDRIVEAFRMRHRLAMMCSEIDPERCHRAKLIGVALEEIGVPVAHIDRDGSVVSQQVVTDRLTKGQGALFESEFTSVNRYEPPRRYFET